MNAEKRLALAWAAILAALLALIVIAAVQVSWFTAVLAAVVFALILTAGWAFDLFRRDRWVEDIDETHPAALSRLDELDGLTADDWREAESIWEKDEQ